jgi:hypothetical protein
MPSMLSASLLVYLKPEEAQNYQLHRLETLGLGSTPRSSLACRSGSDGQDRALRFANHPVRFCVRNIACETRPGLRTHDDEVRFCFLRDSQNLPDGLTDRDLEIQLTVQVGFSRH